MLQTYITISIIPCISIIKRDYYYYYLTGVGGLLQHALVSCRGGGRREEGIAPLGKGGVGGTDGGKHHETGEVVEGGGGQSGNKIGQLLLGKTGKMKNAYFHVFKN